MEVREDITEIEWRPSVGFVMDILTVSLFCIALFSADWEVGMSEFLRAEDIIVSVTNPLFILLWIH